MKTLITTALLAALTLGTAAGADGPGAPQAAPPVNQEQGKPAGKKIDAQELGAMLHAMGIETKPVTNKDGKLVGHYVTYQSEGWTIVAQIDIVGDRIWFRCVFTHGLLDEKSPASVALALLGVNDQLFPASVMYVPKQKTFMVFLEVQNGNVTPAVLRAGLDKFTASVKAAGNAYTTAKAKHEAIAKEKAEEKEKK
jgi:hypothetical protein